MPEKYELTDIKLAALGVDEYQRGLVRQRAERISGRFDIAKAGVIVVSKRARGEGWFIIDGQHRTRAALGAEVEALPAILWTGLTEEREAELFYSFNNDRWSVNPVDLFRTRVFARDPIASDITHLLAEAGVRIGHTRSGLSATAAVETVYHWGWLPQTLRVLRAAFPDNDKALNGNPLQAIGSLFKNYGGNLDSDRLIEVLSERGLVTWLQAAEGMRAALGGTLWPQLAAVILNEYNTGRRQKLDNYRKPTAVRGGKFNLVNPSAG